MSFDKDKTYSRSTSTAYGVQPSKKVKDKYCFQSLFPNFTCATSLLSSCIKLDVFVLQSHRNSVVKERDFASHCSPNRISDLSTPAVFEKTCAPIESNESESVDSDSFVK